MKNKLITAGALIMIAAALSSCFLFGENYEPGDQMYDGKWYAEHDYGLGDRVVRGVFDDSLMEWEEEYDNEFSYSLVRYYDDGTEVDLLADVRDENGLLRMSCHVEDNTFVISGLPSWEMTEDSYVVGEVVNYGGSESGQAEGYLFSRTFRPASVSEETVIDIGSYQVKPINTAYSLTFNIKYIYQSAEVSYADITAAGFELTGGNAWSGGVGYETGNYARLLHEVTDAEAQAGKIVIENCIAGGKYSIFGNVRLDGELKGFPSSGDPSTVTIDASNPSPELTVHIVLD